jgi:triacylglycerol esterase/lipase EstA (alpha/beta hydrolase family)
MWALVVACTSEHGIPTKPPEGPTVEGSSLTTPTGTTPTSTPGCAASSAEEGDYVPQGSSWSDAGGSCVARTHATAGAAGSTLAVHVEVDRPVVVSAVDPGGRSLLAPTPVESSADLELAPMVTGEVLLTLTPSTVDPYDYDLDVSCADGCDRWWTRYPILLMHGLGGAATFDGVDYFFEVPGDLTGHGLVVEAPSVSPFATPQDRAAEWEPLLDALLAEGHRRVNLIGHSQGGLDARQLASPAGLDRGDVVASVTSIGSPHRGAEVADLVDQGLQDGWLDPDVLDLGAALFGSLYGLDTSDPEFAAAVESLSTATSIAWDAATVDAPDTAYFSWAGHSCGVLQPDCIDTHGGEVVDPVLAASFLIEWPTPNDGLVTVDSAQHGDFLGEIWADHLDEIGQFADVVNPAFDHLAFYEGEALRLREAGY